MSDAPEAAGSTPVPAPPANTEAPISVSEAASLLSRSRTAPKEPPPPVEEPAAPAEVDPPAHDFKADKAEKDTAPEEDPGETEPTDADPDSHELPPIEPPRAWTKEEKAEFAELPRSMQEKISARETARETDFRRRQNTATEAAKAAEAAVQQATQLRQQYEQALPALLQNLHAQNNAEFSDITSWEAAQKLAAEDPFRYSQWDLHQKRMQAVQAEVQQTAHKRAAEDAQQYEQWSASQDAEFAKLAPEFSDPKSAEKVQAEAAKYLTTIGFAENELAESWNGKRPMYLRDARTQILIRDAMRWRAAEAKRAEVSAKPVPPVQRPGAPVSRGERSAANTQALERKLDQSGSMKDAMELLRLRRSRG